MLPVGVPLVGIKGLEAEGGCPDIESYLAVESWCCRLHLDTITK